MNKPINLLVGGLTLFAAQGCKAPKQASQQAEHPNIIYVFPDQYRNQAMGFWRQDGFRDKVNFEGDPVHTPNLDAFARESMVLSSAQSNCPLSSPHRGMLLTGMYPNKSGVPLNCNSTRPISYERGGKRVTENERNGHSSKTLKSSSLGNIRIDVPRDRKGEFEPRVVPKHKRQLAGFEDKVLALYARGLSTREIQGFLYDLNSRSVSCIF